MDSLTSLKNSISNLKKLTEIKQTYAGICDEDALLIANQDPNIKKAWCVCAANDNYVWGCLRFAQRMKWLNSKFPTLVMLSDSISKQYIELLEKNDIEYQIVEDFQSMGKTKQNVVDDRLTLFNVLAPLAAKNYDILCVSDCDIISKNSSDLFFDRVHIDAVFGILSWFQNERTKIKFPQLSHYFCRPNIQVRDALIDFIIAQQEINNFSSGEEKALGDFIDAYNNSLIHLELPNGLYQEFSEAFTQRIAIWNNLIHFQNKLKPWNPDYTALYHVFTKFTYEEFNKFIDTYQSQIQMLNAFVVLSGCFKNDPWEDGLANALFDQLNDPDFINSFVDYIKDWQQVFTEGVNQDWFAIRDQKN